LKIEKWMDPREHIKRLEYIKQHLLKFPPNKIASKKYQKTLENLDRTLRMLYRQKNKFEKAGLI